jgi:SynChlorMet cassette protein ScmD
MISPVAPVANPLIVLREEFDDWAVLFNPDTGAAFAIDPVAVFIWKRLDGKKTIDDIVTDLRTNCEDVPDNADEHCRAFIDDLLKRGMAGCETKE